MTAIALSHSGGRRQLHGRDGGGVSVELVLLTPLLLVLLLFVVAAGRLVDARLQVDGAAAQAARAATVARDPATATTLAEQTAASALGADHVSCARLSVRADLAGFTPGGAVQVTVTCTVDLADLTGLHLPAAETVTATASSVLDRYRSVT